MLFESKLIFNVLHFCFFAVFFLFGGWGGGMMKNWYIIIKQVHKMQTYALSNTLLYHIHFHESCKLNIFMQQVHHKWKVVSSFRDLKLETRSSSKIWYMSRKCLLSQQTPDVNYLSLIKKKIHVYVYIYTSYLLIGYYRGYIFIMR